MEKIKSTILIQKLSLAYFALYVLLLIGGDIGGSFFTVEGIVVYSFFILFIIGLSISWFNRIVTGTMFLLWNTGMWILSLFVIENPNGSIIIGGFPVLVLGVFFLLKGMEEKRKTPLQLNEKWRTTLQLFITNYTVLYILVIIESMTVNHDVDFNNFEGVILISLLFIYTIGFIFSWKKELVAGIIFIFWSIGVFYIFIEKFAVSDDGPWTGAWLIILAQSILYFVYHFNIKSSNYQVIKDLHN